MVSPLVTGTGNLNVAGATLPRWTGVLTIPSSRSSKGVFYPRGIYDLVWSSILMIIVTPLGSRPFRRDFGSRFHELLMEPADDVIEGLARLYIRRAVEKWEPRALIVTDGYVFLFDEETIQVEIQFTVRGQEGELDPVTRGIRVKRSSNVEVVNFT